MNITVTACIDQAVQKYVFFVQEKQDITSILQGLDQHDTKLVKAVVAEQKFTGKAKSSVQVPFLKPDGSIVHFTLVGLGAKKDFELVRRAVGSVIKAAKAKKIKTVSLAIVPLFEYNLSAVEVASQITTIVKMAGYAFDRYMSDAKDALKDMCVELCADKTLNADISAGIEQGTIIADAVNTAREWIDMPPSDLVPTDVAQNVQKLAQEVGVQCTVFDKKKIEELKMGGLLGVARASVQEPRFIILEYMANPGGKLIALVGKGITFDSGGLSLKPANSMENMKEDMAGAACVMNTVIALAKLQAKVNVVAVAPVTENMISGSATKPGDVLRFYNGKTAEVLNTDAEGRLVLADALSYTVDVYKPAVMIDVATLTGACDYAVGPYFTALISEHDEVVQDLVAAGKRSGDVVWQLPYTDDYKAAIKSRIADIANISTNYNKAGTITAAAFLQHFVGDTAWAHLDIASSSFGIKDISYYDSGATGTSVRLLIDYVLNQK